ncbi:hypothetical protein [Streptomyces sp. NPDC021224]|uniref:hypothetical protein n=1 Tax=unclassified Streptomyces TaxID=2593676 RepID=UPI0037999001
MSKRNTRVRVARIAAAVVVAGGASLTAVGAAQAVSPNHTVVKALDGEGDTDGTISGASQGGTGTPTEEPPTSAPPTEEPPTSAPPTEEPPTSAPPTEEPPTSAPPTEEPPTSAPPSTGTTEGNQNGGNQNGGNANGGNQNGGNQNGGNANGGNTGTDGNNNTCTLTGESVDCGNNNTSTDNTAPVPQGNTTSQLAETGSSGTTFMLLGAATLIAGGVGFTLTPRLAGRRGGGTAA